MTLAPAVTGRRPSSLPSPGLVLRVHAAALVTHLPILAVLLNPQTRSRVSSEPVMAVWTVVLITLVVAALVVVPALSARVAPHDAHWRPGTALGRVRTLTRVRRRAYLRCLAEWAGLYVAAQCVGGLIAWVLPHIWRNPAHAGDPSAPVWEFHYPNFAVQAVGIYLVVCLANAWYACRLRQLALAAAGD